MASITLRVDFQLDREHLIWTLMEAEVGGHGHGIRDKAKPTRAEILAMVRSYLADNGPAEDPEQQWEPTTEDWELAESRAHIVLRNREG